MNHDTINPKKSMPKNVIIRLSKEKKSLESSQGEMKLYLQENSILTMNDNEFLI